MHQAWQIHEIATCIIRHAKTYDAQVRVEAASLSALAALARTCQTLSSPALDELWAEPPDLLPILKCLPSHLWQSRVVPGGFISATEFKLKGTPSAADWRSIRKHAHRVKRIALRYYCRCWGTNSWTDCHCFGGLDVLNTNIAHWYHGSALFPNLTSFEYVLQTPNDTPYGTMLPECVLKLPGSQLQRLSLCPMSLLSVNGQVSQLPQNIEGFVQVEDTLAPIGQTFPALTVIMLGYMPDLAELDRPGQTTELSLAQQELLAKLPELQYIENAIPLPNAWQTSLRVYAALQNLRNLALVLPDFSPDKFDASLPLIRFPSLTSLTFTVQKYAATITDALRAIQAPRLRSFKVVLRTFGSDANIKRMLDAASDFSTLEDVTLTISAEDELSDNLIAIERGAVVSGSAFAPLLRLRGFRSLTVSGNVGCAIDDGFVEIMAKAWPALHILRVKLPKCQERPLTTASSVLSLVTHCPGLHTVCLAMNAAVPLGDATLATAESLPKTNVGRVFELNDMSTPVRDHRIWARFLRALQFRLAANKITTYSTLTGGWEMVDAELTQMTGRRVELLDDDDVY
ncbi:hypothetical protein NM688_g1554 [Phlebia brevispora]|uniref:Uncharacterized protein n=1 Tax=Phlebia brevispora TaxID=194682 RepID=A0ACC1TBG9_9APHY|nr:hypothetical protein NM688_g1554 [Phlebia brevispora]